VDDSPALPATNTASRFYLRVHASLGIDGFAPLYFFASFERRNFMKFHMKQFNFIKKYIENRNIFFISKEA
jgi:hypothetical protein